MDHTPRVAALTELVPSWMLDAARDGGARIVPVEQADTIVWGGGDVPPAHLAELLDDHGDNITWVQLPWAGVEPYLDLLDDERLWTCAKSAYGDDVAEMALAMMLAGVRGLVPYSRASSWRGPGELGANLFGAQVCIVGGGGIAEQLIALLAPFRCRITVVRRRDLTMDGADRVVTVDRLDEALGSADVVVLALALTPATERLFDRRRLSSMRSTAWLVNVARGAHVVTDDLAAALRDGTIAGAALDVTDPEPLPDGHPLWSTPNCLITPHVANTSAMLQPRLAERITENVRRRMAGDQLLGVVDPRGALPTGRLTPRRADASRVVGRGWMALRSDDDSRPEDGARRSGSMAAITRVVLAMCGDRALAEDSAQEALVRAWERVDEGDDLRSLEAWTIRVALNWCRSQLRRHGAEGRAVQRLERRAPRGSAPDAATGWVRSTTLGTLECTGRSWRCGDRQREVVFDYLDMDVAFIGVRRLRSRGRRR